jgi:hypothetical protein
VNLDLIVYSIGVMYGVVKVDFILVASPRSVGEKDATGRAPH